ncbi:MAG: hypothetical protein HXS48_14080 [Theionarchaea archaeon]|nr:hypothetical protein [Theionarchaea archaeon]
MFAKLISSGGGILPRSRHCSSGHLPTGDCACFNGYVPWIGICAFGKET